MKRLTCVTLAVLGALAVTACGLRGDLDRPPPLWGDPPEQDDGADDSGHEDGDS
jgi:predicted small lipoprotein YifL